MCVCMYGGGSFVCVCIRVCVRSLSGACMCVSLPLSPPLLFLCVCVKLYDSCVCVHACV